MKRFPIFLCIYLGLGVLGIATLLQYKKSGETKTPLKPIGSAASSQIKESFPHSAALSSISKPLINDHQSTEPEVTTTEILRRVPQALKPREVINFDEVEGESERRVRRVMVSTNSTLGKILIHEHIADNKIKKREIFSAEHLVVPIAKNANENEIAASIEQSGFKVTKPFSGSDFLFAHLEVETPSALF